MNSRELDRAFPELLRLTRATAIETVRAESLVTLSPGSVVQDGLLRFRAVDAGGRCIGEPTDTYHAARELLLEAAGYTLTPAGWR